VPAGNSVPTIVLFGTNPIILTVGGTFTDPGATSLDAEDGILAITITGTVNTAVVGTTTLTYSVIDSGGLTASITRDVVVNVAPVTPVENTSPLCSDGIDNDNDNLIDLADPDCSAFVPVTPTGSGGGGNGGGGGGNGPITGTFGISLPGSGGSIAPSSGQVLGAYITPEELGKVFGVATCSTEYLNSYIKTGAKNDPEQVKKLQSFLNENQGANLPLTGIYGSLTMKAVNKFQVAHGVYVLKPWIDAGLHSDIKEPTGYVYKTTKRWINLLMCPDLNIPIPQLP
jgi:hypothetical protein